MVIPIATDEGDVVSIEPWEHNRNVVWPEAQLQTVTNGQVKLCNATMEPLYLGKEIKKCKVRSTTAAEVKPQSYYAYTPTLNTMVPVTKVDQIDLSNINNSLAKQIILDAHDKYQDVFNKDLSKGYNNFFGKHVCRLNWATAERSSADKVRVPSYNHGLKSLQQELMDDLTDQGVLLIPQDHNKQVQSVCPSFIQRKQKAKNKPENQLTKNTNL